MKALLLLILLVTGCNSNSDKAKDMTINMANGEQIEAILHVPATLKGKMPALIIGAGQGYHMELPLIKMLAEKATQNGIITLRFNWRFYTNKGKRSKDYANEKEDMNAALNYIRSLPNVDKDKIMVAGKSLGTMVAYSIFAANKDLFALYLLTPVCTWQWDDKENEIKPYPVGEKKYPKFNSETRPIHITLGSNDIVCRTGMLYEFIKSKSVTTTVFGGGHSLNIGKWDDPKFKKRNAANIEMAINATVHWMNMHLEK